MHICMRIYIHTCTAHMYSYPARYGLQYDSTLHILTVNARHGLKAAAVETLL